MSSVPSCIDMNVDQSKETGEPVWAEIDLDVVWVIDPPAFLAGTYDGHDGSGGVHEDLYPHPFGGRP